jgi:HSP20 family protein
MSGRWEPFDQLTSLRDAMGRLMDQSFIFSGRGQSDGSPQSIPVNVFESEEILMVVAPVPGLQQEDIEITARGNSLTIEGRERADLKPDTQKRYLRHEWRYGPYHRTVELPYAVDSSSAEATMGDGVLTIRLTKAATERSHKINVKTNM